MLVVSLSLGLADCVEAGFVPAFVTWLEGCVVVGFVPASVTWLAGCVVIVGIVPASVTWLAGCVVVVVGIVPAFVTVLSLIPTSLSITNGQLTARTITSVLFSNFSIYYIRVQRLSLDLWNHYVYVFPPPPPPPSPPAPVLGVI